ncbi:unnamed protein product, partial [Mesorhabditis belari]|uniref:Centrosomal protein CEP104 Zn finger domain-containing protein n=1 Tax=Mesorhabditis belari TaxID=2138241 RepID=A0AAF3J1V8_9BILA
MASSGTSSDGRPSRTGSADYKMPNYGYKSDGYQSGSANLGDDPVSAVRTLRNQMRQKMSNYQSMNLPVKAHLCQTACDTLSRAEGQLIGMNNKRRNALMVGDSGSADQMKVQMDQVKDDAIRNAYADLVTDSNQMNAYGVDSKWTPQEESHPPRNPTPQPLLPRPSSDRTKSRRGPSNERFRPNSVARKPRRQRRPPSPEGNQTPFSMQKGPNPQPEFDPDIRRNGRLAEMERRKRGEFIQPTSQAEANAMLFDNPYKPPNQYGQCPYCDRVEPSFGRKQNLERHYTTDCPMLVKCRYCNKVVQARELTNHYLDRCVFLEDKMKPCPLCGLAADEHDIADGVSHPLCRGRMAPSGARWCALCAVAVDDNKESWKRHLQLGPNGCYNNPRLNGEEALLERRGLDGRDPMAPNDGTYDPNNPNGANGGTNTTTNSKTSTKTTSKLNGAKLIDADQLV